jgi:phosphoribosylformylglycinamidine synthase
MAKIRVLVLRTAGTNCDKETAFAFREAGAEPELVHVNSLTGAEISLSGFHILAIPGGFSYGDDIASGKILANELKFGIADEVRRFIKDGKLIIGICNGFQVLVKGGLLPNIAGDFKTIESTLTLNDSARFEDRWVYLSGRTTNDERRTTKCVWTKGIDKTIYLPVAHGEGKFVPRDNGVLDYLNKNDMVVFRYAHENGAVADEYPANPNGSVEAIAGICDATGRILGLMPHPERHVSYLQHPRWTRNGKKTSGDGFAIFSNGVRFCEKYL